MVRVRINPLSKLGRKLLRREGDGRHRQDDCILSDWYSVQPSPVLLYEIDILTSSLFLTAACHCYFYFVSQASKHRNKHNYTQRSTRSNTQKLSMDKERDQIYEPLSHDDSHSSGSADVDENQSHNSLLFLRRRSQRSLQWLPRFIRLIEIFIVMGSLAFGFYGFIWFDKSSSDQTCPIEPFFRPGTCLFMILNKDLRLMCHSRVGSYQRQWFNLDCASHWARIRRFYGGTINGTWSCMGKSIERLVNSIERRSFFLPLPWQLMDAI